MPFKPISHSQRQRRRLGPKIKPKRKDAAAVEIRNSAAWQKVRAMVLREQPLCCDPYGDHAKEGRLVPTEEIHHVVPLSVDPSMAYDLENLAGLCVACHRRIDQDNRDGIGTRHRFPIGKSPSASHLLKNEHEGGRGQS
jgi:5-methylcytosine-specific restriction endonuclease McrA